MTLWVWAFWGLLGAFVYAAPRLLVALFESDGSTRVYAKSIAELLVALAFGPIGAAGFGPVLATEFHRVSLAELRAIALVVGMIANPVAPGVVHLVGDGILRRLGGPPPLKVSRK